MSVEPQKAQYYADLVATAVVSLYAKERGLPPTDAKKTLCLLLTQDFLFLAR